MITRVELGDASGYEALSPTGSTGITSTLITPTSGQHKEHNAVGALIAVETNPIRMMLNGAVATADNGIKIDPGQTYEIVGGSNVKNFRCMDTIAGASSVKVIVFH